MNFPLLFRRAAIILLAAGSALAGAPLSKRLAFRLEAEPGKALRAWIYAHPAADLSNPAAAARFTASLKGLGLRVRRVSLWLNAVSVEAGEGALKAAAALPEVSRLDPVEQFRKPKVPRLAKAAAAAGVDTFYGYAHDALRLMRVPAAHALPDIGKLSAGKGVTLALLDAGFNLSHEAFSHFDSATVIAARDYVAGILDSTIAFDTVVRNEPGESPDQEGHGTSVLSVIAAYKPGKLVGIAPFSRFVLAKTEQTQALTDSVWGETETVAEEDNWIAAVEWAVDTMKADIVSSSLGYRYDFTDGRQPYSIDALDGDSLAITRAADLAALKGAVVIVAVGNDGTKGTSSLAAPSDGNNVLAVGAVDANGNLAYYSSLGPTGDGRIKPDVVAPGHMSAVTDGNAASYNLAATGTSFAAPMAAGACALLLQYTRAKNAPLSVPEVIDRFRQFSFFTAAADSGTPGYGFGIVDALGLLTREKMKPETGAVPVGGLRFRLYPVPVKAGPIRFEVVTDNTALADDRSRRFETAVYSVAGELLFFGKTREAAVGAVTSLTWDLKNSRGRKMAPGVYLVRARFVGPESSKNWTEKFAVTP